MIQIDDLLPYIEMSLNQFWCYLNRETGRCLTLTEEDFRNADARREGKTAADRAAIDHAYHVLNDPAWLRLPTRQDVNEYRIMQLFVQNVVVNEAKIQELNRLLASGMAEGRWMNTVTMLNLKEDWLRFRRQMLRRVAVNWCLMHGLDFEA